MGQHPWALTTIIGIIAASMTFLGMSGTKALGRIGASAYQSGSNPKAPDSFSAFFLQAARIAIVGVIVLATVILAMAAKLNEGAVAILSGVAGYVLGGVRSSQTSAQTPAAIPSNLDNNS
jgi:hypothetical protein